MKATWIIDQLICQGVEHFCIAPGSRSSPLALAVANHPKAKATVHFDERGLGFFALGIGKGTKKPAAVITTSGTAVANLFPSILEASHSYTPFLVLTADRPHQLRNCGANQTIDQVNIFGHCVRSQFELTPYLDEKTTRSIAAQALFDTLKNPPGPVQINCPFEEPLHTEDPIIRGNAVEYTFPTLHTPPYKTSAKNGVILLGPLSENPSPVLALAKRLKWPIFIDLLSRSSKIAEQICSMETISKAPTPDLILHIGGRFVSKRALSWSPSVKKVHVSPYPYLQDPDRTVTQRVQSDIESFCNRFQADLDPNWLKIWKELDIEPTPIPIPLNNPLFLGNSLPIREADSSLFPETMPPVYANRGVSGIDGNIATMAGIAEGLQGSITGYIGDQTALHDLNSLPLIKKFKLLLIISNNFGGRIFEKLPIGKSPHLARFFTASHSLSFEKGAEMFEIPYVKRKRLHSLPEWGIVEICKSEQCDDS